MWCAGLFERKGYAEHVNMCFYCSMEDNDVEDEIEDLLSYFEQELTLESAFPKICTPELDLTQMHISGHCS